MTDYRRKADQAYELAGCAAQDGDKADAAHWLRKAKEYDRLASEEEKEKPKDEQRS